MARQTARHIYSPLILAVILWLSGITASCASPASRAPSPEAKTLASQLAAAPDDASRDKLLAAALPGLAGNTELLDALLTTVNEATQHGNFASAEATAAFTSRLADRLNQPFYSHRATLAQAGSEVTRGEDAAALRRLETCRMFFENAGEKDHLGSVLTSEAVVYFHRNEYRNALPLLRQAHDLYVELGSKEGQIATLNIIANVFGDQGQAERAAEYQKQALALAGDDPYWQTALFHNIASVYISQGDYANAIVYMEKSGALAGKLGDQPSLGSDLEALGECYNELGRVADAEKAFRQALEIAVTAGQKSQQATCLNGLALLALARGGDDLRAGLAQAEHSLALARETNTASAIWHGEITAGKLRRALGDRKGAQTAFLEAIAVIEDSRGHLTGGDQEATAFLADKLEPYQCCVALLVEDNRPAEALAMAERGKARVLIEVLDSPKSDPASVMTVAERATAKQRADEIAVLNRQIAAAKIDHPPAAPAQIELLEGKLTAARRARENAESDFFIAHPELRNRQPLRDTERTLSSNAIRTLLADQKTALLEFVVNDDETFLFTVKKSKNAAPDAAPDVQAQRIALGRKALAARAKDFRASLAERSLGWQAAARSLGKDLLAPAWPACADAGRLVIVADGPLWDLPFQALLIDADTSSGKSRTLWEALAVSYAPSLTFLAQTPEARTPATRTARLLAVGDPALALALPDKSSAGEKSVPGISVLMDDEAVPLPDAERQVAMLAELYGPERGRTLVGAQAHEDLFKKLSGDYDVLHFATHGFLNDAAPMYSRLLMAQTDLAADEDGFLEAWEWLPLKLNARLAVLSACETGRGRVGEGEGVLGLSWALFGAGCPAAVVSQWKVDSASTTELMVAFHKRLLAGAAPADALREAGLELAKDPKYRHPFYWAPFVLVGASNPIVAR